jgi:hypothetical protein
MFGFTGGIPTMLKHVFSKFKRFFTKPQYKNFCRTELGLITAGKREHDIKSINEQFTDIKNQSSLNRFITTSKWTISDIVKEGQELLLSETQTDPTIEYKVIDDTVCRKYSAKTELTCYNHSTMLGTVLSHDYVTGLYVNNDVAVLDGLKLYGSEKKCHAKKAVFKTKLELACELIDDHKQRAKRTVMLWDSW